MSKRGRKLKFLWCCEFLLFSGVWFWEFLPTALGANCCWKQNSTTDGPCVCFQELQTECVQASVEKEQAARTTRAHLQEKEDEIQVSEMRKHWVLPVAIFRVHGSQAEGSRSVAFSLCACLFTWRKERLAATVIKLKRLLQFEDLLMGGYWEKERDNKSTQVKMKR